MKLRRQNRAENARKARQLSDQYAGSNPWIDAEARYQPGQAVRGTITRVTQFGVFVQLEPGVEGILYAFELGQGPSALIGFVPGQEVQLYVRTIEVSKKRLELSLQNHPVPGLLEGNEVPAHVRRNKQSEELSWPMPFLLPGAQTGGDERCCPTCQRVIQAVWKYCVYCGGSLYRYCSACGATQPDLPGAHYCCECGKPL
jgi:predicted RNA-binding protein with RPS1 domain